MCRECFFAAFEDEVHQTVTSAQLFKDGDKIAVGASGGKGLYCRRSFSFTSNSVRPAICMYQSETVWHMAFVICDQQGPRFSAEKLCKFRGAFN